MCLFLSTRSSDVQTEGEKRGGCSRGSLCRTPRLLQCRSTELEIILSHSPPPLYAVLELRGHITGRKTCHERSPCMWLPGRPQMKGRNFHLLIESITESQTSMRATSLNQRSLRNKKKSFFCVFFVFIPSAADVRHIVS